MDYKKAFYSRLEDCYLGAKIKQAQSHHATLQESKAQDEQASQKAQSELNTAQSGFTNLLMIKERYFTHIKAHLEARIKALVGDDIIETNDIYNKLYTFFDNYLNETGTPFFTDTPIYKNIYAKIYSNSKDTSLFYKTQNLYYVKSDTLYQSLILQSNTGKFSLYFDASEFKQNADNNKNKVIFKFDDISFVSASEQDEKSAFENSILQITIKVSNQKDLFPNLSAVFKSNSNEFSDEFLKTLSQRQIISKKPTQSELDELKKLFRAYKKQNEIDFFIHKDALSFLKEQFDLWMFSYLYKDSEFQEWSAFAIKRLQMVKNLAYELIEFIAKFENELKAIWLKPKFAKNTQYVFSIDTILLKAQNANTLLASIFEDANFHTQIAEWKELNLIDDDFSKKDILQNEKYKFLPIDTKHLSKENKFALLNAFENLETLLNGELIKSDNFQALNTLMPKYQGKIDLIYIDPPYNTGNDDFIYADKFNHASWLSMMNNRLELSKNILNDKGSIFVSIDDNEQANLKLLMDNVFGDENFVSNIIWQKKKGGSQDSQNFAKEHEYILCYSKREWQINDETQRQSESDFCKVINGEKAKILKLEKWEAGSSREDAPSLYYSIKDPNGKDFYPIAPNGTKGRWRKKPENLDSEHIYWQEDSKGRLTPYEVIYFDEVKDKEKIIKTRTIFTDYGTTTDATKEILNLFNNQKVFDTTKPEKLLNRIAEIASKKDSIILDFFAGSGTTCAVALKLGRKFLGVEMGEHFYKVALPRLKKVLAGFASGISKECEFKGGGAFRYYELESYEEALANCEYVLNQSIIASERSERGNPQETNSCHTERSEVSKNKNANTINSLDSSLSAKAQNDKNRDISPTAQYDKMGNDGIIDYRKSRKLIKELNKEPNKPITLNMSGYRAEFDIFQSIANLMGWKIKRLFLDNGEQACEYDNGEILRADNINLGNEKLHKLKNLLWWE